MAAGDVSKGLLARVRNRIGQPAETAIGDAEIYQHLNRAQEDLLWRLDDGALTVLTETATGSLTAARVALPADFCRERLVLYGASDIEAKRIEIVNVGMIHATYGNVLRQPTATNPFYYIWYNITDAAVRLHIETAQAADTSAYTLHYIKTPTDMSDSVDPLFEIEHQDLLVDFAVARLSEGYRANYEEAERLLRHYRARIQIINSHYRPGGVYDAEPGDSAGGL